MLGDRNQSTCDTAMTIFGKFIAQNQVAHYFLSAQTTAKRSYDDCNYSLCDGTTSN